MLNYTLSNRRRNIRVIKAMCDRAMLRTSYTLSDSQMKNSLISGLFYMLANGAGLLIATLLLPGFKIGFSAFIFATLLFSGIELVLKPLILKLSRKSIPALEGGIALVTTFAGLFITSILLSGMEIGGISNWLAATLLVWLGALIAGTLLPRFLFKEVDNKT